MPSPYGYPQYGYPGYTQVGTAGGTACTLLHCLNQQVVSVSKRGKTSPGAGPGWGLGG